MLAKLAISLSLIFFLSHFGATVAANELELDLDPIDAGRILSFDTNKGNCLGCHAIPNDAAAISPGNLGPKLQNIKSRYSDRSKLRWKIYDSSSTSPKTAMPPFGKNKILTPTELDLVVEYIYSI
jgi:sulfur-oxidizing protein SoxX